jgi:16S rRNA (cytosine1402-N4)-methyltransferase
MNDLPHFERPPRRPRYRGRNPRTFAERYKEHDPAQYPEEAAKVTASGRTPAGSHRPIMVAELLAVLRPQPGDVAVDATLGYGGHAREVLSAILPGGRLIGIDADPAELPRTERRLRVLGHGPDVFSVHRTNFAGLSGVIAAETLTGVDIVYADLGVSSMQYDNPERGFSFKTDGPLDMRMNPARGLSAAELLSRLDEAALATLLEEYADLPGASRMARHVLLSHSRSPISGTLELATIVRTAASQLSSEDATHTVRRVFQALRIAVNDELGTLTSLLRQLPGFLKPGGRVAILTFHSGEDRLVKHAFRAGQAAGIYSQISEEPLRPAPEERHANPRSTSAKLRFAVRASET